MVSTAIERRDTTVREGEPLRGSRSYRPNVDIVEKADELMLIADVPGARAEDIDVQFEGGTLKIQARVPEREQGREYLIQEYGVGEFHRTFDVSEQIDAERITAEVKQGVLTLHLPKAEAAKPRKIEVNPA
ncbi:MAG: Hsp20/alpha crystallin family protein [Phycisphaerae bacterium]